MQLRAPFRGPGAACDAGLAAIEFALLLPLFITLLFGLIQSAQILMDQAALQHAVTAAARCASIYATSNSMGSNNTPTDCSTATNVTTVGNQNAYGLVSSSITWTTTGLNTNSSNCLTATYPYAFNIPPFGPNMTITLSANSCFPTPPSTR